MQRPNAVVVAPLRRDAEGNLEVLLVRQLREPVGEPELWELVAGKVEAGEGSLDTAIRELAEEAGYAATEWRGLADGLIPASGYSDERIDTFAAFGLSEVERRAEDAHIVPIWMPLDEALRMVRDNEIRELKARDVLRTLVERVEGWEIV